MVREVTCSHGGGERATRGRGEAEARPARSVGLANSHLKMWDGRGTRSQRESVCMHVGLGITDRGSVWGTREDLP